MRNRTEARHRTEAEIHTCAVMLSEMGLAVGTMGRREDGAYYRIISDSRRDRSLVIAAESPAKVNDAVCWHACDLIDRRVRRQG